MATPEEQFGHILSLLDENSKGITELKHSMEEMKLAKTDFEAWKPEVNHRVADLEHAVNYLGERMCNTLGVKHAFSLGIAWAQALLIIHEHEHL